MHHGRRQFLAIGLAAGSLLASGRFSRLAHAAPPTRTVDIPWLPAWRLRALIADKYLSPVEVTQLFLERIDTLDNSLDAYEEVIPDSALQAARAAEKAVLAGKNLGPLHGVPVSLKQMIAVQGLRLETGDLATRDAITTERLRNAGAIILGSTTLAGPADMLGEARVGAANPWNLQRVAGSSSSGSAASVAAGLCTLSIGSDGGGSTRLPAAWCGLLGLHPTVGRVPADPDPLRAAARTSWSASYGPMTRDALDAAITLGVIAGPHWRNLHSFNGPAPDYLAGIEDGAAGLKIAWTEGFTEIQRQPVDGSGPHATEVLKAVRQSAADFTLLGAKINDIKLDLGDWYPVFTRIAAELSAGALYPLLASGARIWNRLQGRDTAPLWQGDLQEALLAREQMAGRLLEVFRQHDILASATSPRIAPTREEYADWLDSDTFSPEYTCLTGHMNLLGFPAISIPAGFVNGMPVGLQLIAPPDREDLLLRAAVAFTHNRKFEIPTGFRGHEK